jgi:hypothetical protein
VLLRAFRYSVFPWLAEPVVARCEYVREPEFASYEAFKSAYDGALVHPTAPKRALIESLWRRFQGVNKSFQAALLGWVDPARVTRSR